MKTPTVPRLNLAPKRRKPLSLWNPLDYLQLLYWVFFFPQALRWYVETFGGGKKLNDCTTDAERREWWQNSLTQESFWLQGLLSTIVAPLFIVWVLSYLGISVNALGVALGVALGGVVGFTVGLAFGGAFGLAVGVVVSSTVGFAFGLAFGLTVGLAFGAAFGGLVGVAFGAAFSITFGLAFGVAEGTAYGVSLYVMYGIAFGVVFGSSVGWSVGGVVGIAFGVAVLRPETWIVVTLSRRLSIRSQLGSFSRTTSISLPGLTSQIADWLNSDWIPAVYNANELLAYTQQFVPVMNAVNQSLAEMPTDILVLRISQLSENPFDWDLIQYASVSLSNKLKETFVDGIFYLPGVIKRRLQTRLNTNLRLNTPARAVAAGFWLLHEGQPRKAAEAFAQVQNLPHGTEMYQLATCLFLASTAKQLNDDRLVNVLTIPTSPLLRSDTWPAISRLRSVVDDAQIIYQSYSRSARSLALNRALGKLTEITQRIDSVPQAERKLVASIAESWQEKLLAIATGIGEITHTQPVHNPYVAGDPVEGNLFIGRGEVIKQLEELWLMSNQLQSVVLYGHRRMGKTSILKNLSHYLGNNIKVVYINLLNLGEVSEGTGEVLITLSDAISQSFSLSPPDDETLLRLPEVTFRRFIQAINQKLKDNQGLIIALDEFEKIEELILAGKLSPNFLGFLRGLLQEYPKIAFAFAGLHTLEEMTEDYFSPFFASILPIRIGFFSIGETRQLLANPAEDFTLDYTPETLNEIYRLTAGQPYLTQLIGFQLVRHYNHQLFERGQERNPIFTPEDLTTVIHHSGFFDKGRYYFTGVWSQAAQDAPGQQAVLKVLASKVEGSAQSEIRRQTNLSPTEIDQALKTLQRHDVVKAEEGNWKIIVPLFRQWVLEYQ